MKSLFLLIFLFPAIAWSYKDEVCNPKLDAKSFITDWNSGGDNTKVLSTLVGTEFVTDHGRLVYVGDLNSDGNSDFIYEASTGIGSSGDRVYSFLLQCHGYLKLLGADYFADVKVVDLDSTSLAIFKDIEIYSYKRRANGSIQWVDGKPLMTSHVWRFNLSSKKYEGKSE